MIIINFKSYKKGIEVLKLAKTIQKRLPKAVVAVPSLNIHEVSKKTKLKVYAQHVSSPRNNKATASLTVDSTKKSGAKGTLLNHSEHKIKLGEIKKTLKACKKLNLKVIVCASNLAEAKKIKKLKPQMIAFEDPKLISTGKSITKYKPNELKKFVSLLKPTKIMPLCGAGISSKEDYKQALKFGCKGVLVSSIVAKSKNPEKFLKDVS